MTSEELATKTIDYRPTEWDRRFLDLVHVVASWSKDPSTKVGSLIVDDKKRGVSWGFNGPPRHADDARILADRNTKLACTIHAEENAILFAQRNLEGCSIYVTHAPCSNCAAKIIQTGMREIIVPEPDTEFKERWGESMKLAEQMLKESNVKLIKVKYGA